MSDVQTAHPRDENDALCRMVKDVLGCDAVALTLWGAGAGTDADADDGCAGLTRADTQRLSALFRPGEQPEPALSRAMGAAPTDNREGSFRAELTRMGFASCVRSPLSHDGTVVGLLFALSVSPRRPDVRLVNALARCCEFALEYDQHPLTEHTLSDVDSLVLHTDSFAALLPALHEVMTGRLGEVAVGISVLDAASGLLNTAAGSFGLSESVTRSYAIDPNDLHSNAARVFELQRPFVSNRVIGDPAILQAYPIAFGIRSMVALPLIVSGRSTGVLMIANKAGGFQPDDLDAATAIAPQIAVAVELARLNEARRFARESEQIVDLSSRLAGAGAAPGAEAQVLGSVLGRAAELLHADEIRLERPGTDLAVRYGPESLRMAGPGAAPTLPVHDMRIPCGGPDADSAALVATRTAGGAFTAPERQLLADLAAQLSQSAGRRHAERQEAELAQHRERQRIADDLHDDVSQLLFAAQLALDEAVRDPGGPDARVVAASDLVRRAETALRDVIFELPLLPNAFSREIQTVVDSVRAEWRLQVELQVDPAVDAAVSPDAALELVRAARECLVNVVKHAGPCTASVAVGLIDDTRTVVLRVTDTGTGSPGLPPRETDAARGHGLQALRRRTAAAGGDLTVRGIPGHGTTITVTMPAAARA